MAITFLFAMISHHNRERHFAVRYSSILGYNVKSNHYSGYLALSSIAINVGKDYRFGIILHSVVLFLFWQNQLQSRMREYTLTKRNRHGEDVVPIFERRVESGTDFFDLCHVLGFFYQHQRFGGSNKVRWF